ncbi:MAG: DNA adenine methylase [Halanaerobiales bacterium]
MIKENLDVKPFLKWAGGKRQLLEQFEDNYPDALLKNKIDCYIEPFVGGGAVFFELVFKYDFDEIFLNDVNEELIITYKVVRDELNKLIKHLKRLEEEYLPLELEERKLVYYDTRDKFNAEKKAIDYSKMDEDAIQHASHFIFLNRTCFNGLYRQNKSGEFNVPIGRYKSPTICNEENLYAVSTALQNVKLTSCDFEEMETNIKDNTFIYLDPPYRPLPGTPSFTKYSKSDFNEESQKRLARWYRKIDELYNKNKVYLMLSNSNPKNTDPDDNFFEKLYKGYTIEEVYAKRAINSKASKRGELSELIIKDY